MKLSELTIKEVENLSHKYFIPEEDIILIALNCLGIKANIPNKRIRFRLKLNNRNEIFYFAICVNTNKSPFSLNGDGLFFSNEKIGIIRDRENDVCDSTYFRRNKTVLTLNSNSRSNCRGCKFCGTYNQDAEDINNLLSEDRLSARFRGVIKENRIKDLSVLNEIGLCTGCFGDEEEALKHLIMVREVAGRFGFRGEVKYLGSQVISREAIDILKKRVAPFSLYLTLECFSRREDLLRLTKLQLTFKGAEYILDAAGRNGFDTSVLYILGLDRLDVVFEGFRKLKPYITRFPIVNVFQNYTSEHETLRISEAKHIEYYLKARQGIEQIFGDRKLRPHPWENYRGLWYLTFNGDKIKDIRI